MILFLGANREIQKYSATRPKEDFLEELRNGTAVDYPEQFSFDMGEDRQGFWKTFYLEPDNTIRIEYTKIESTIPEPTQLDRIESNTTDTTDAQLIIMEAMADQYEQHQADRLNDMDVQATIYEEILLLKEASGTM